MNYEKAQFAKCIFSAFFFKKIWWFQKKVVSLHKISKYIINLILQLWDVILGFTKR